MNILVSFCTVLTIALFSNFAFAESYEHGHGALQIFDSEGMANAPAWVMTWVYFMGSCFLIGLLFVKNHQIARWVVGGFLLGLIFAMGIAPVLEWPALSGFIALCHVIFWSPALYLLLTRKPFLLERSAYSAWTGVITLVIIFSFLFDIRDAFIYMRHLLGA